MHKFTVYIFVLTLVLSFVTEFSSFAQNVNEIKKAIQSSKTTMGISSDTSESLMDINNITSWVNSAGFHNWNVASLWNGTFPNDSNVGLIYSEGMLWGGKVKDGNTDSIRVDGNFYETSCTPTIHLYRVRPDYLTGDLSQDVADFYKEEVDSVTQVQIDSIRQQYKEDWDNWPADMGAPYKDVNNDGKYEPNIDVPGIPGASQTLFIQYKDNGYLYNTPQIGLKISETYWAYNSKGPIGNVIFKKVDITYTGTSNPDSASYIDSMYIAQFSDPDVGNGLDDFAGCDRTLNLGYAYNAKDSDNIYKTIGLNPPAVGYAFLQGVSQQSGNPNDSAIINLKWRKGYKYVNVSAMSSFFYIASEGQWYTPTPGSYLGSASFYNLMRGKLPDPYPSYPAGLSFPSSVADETGNGTYLLDGDPVASTGKIDGVLDTLGDRRILLENGPFNLKLDNTAEVVVALVAGLGNSNLDSITRLKENTMSADSAYLALVAEQTGNITGISSNSAENALPVKYSLSQNYPNPFNPSTMISYALPKSARVKIEVFNMLGEKVTTLVNGYEQAGIYKVQWDAGNLASGIYLYRFMTDKITITRKMILLK